MRGYISTLTTVKIVERDKEPVTIKRTVYSHKVTAYDIVRYQKQYCQVVCENGKWVLYL